MAVIESFASVECHELVRVQPLTEMLSEVQWSLLEDEEQLLLLLYYNMLSCKPAYPSWSPGPEIRSVLAGMASVIKMPCGARLLGSFSLSSVWLLLAS